MEKESDEAEKALRAVESALAVEKEELAGRVTAADEGLGALAGHVTGQGPRLVTAAEELETAARDLVQASESAESQWEQAFALSQEQQQGITGLLREMASDLASKVDATCQELEQQVAPNMEGAQRAWEEALRELKTSVEDALETLATAYATQGQAAVEGSVGKAREIVGGMVLTAAHFDSYLDRMRDALREAVERQSSDVEGSMHEDVEGLAANVRDAAALLGTYESRFASLGFIP